MQHIYEIERSFLLFIVDYPGNCINATVCKTWGLPDTLVVDDLAEVSTEPDEVTADVQVASVNFPDVSIIQSKYDFEPELPFTAGSEMAGNWPKARSKEASPAVASWPTPLLLCRIRRRARRPAR